MKKNVSHNPQDSRKLELCIGGYSDRGSREVNQDAFAVKVPTLHSEKKYKGIVAAIADGVSCSDKSQNASQTSVSQFITDYYSTPESWSVKMAASKVLTSLNDWLFQQNHQDELRHNGLITTFTCIIFKSVSAYICHVGDSRLYRYRDGQLQQLTNDHARSLYGKNSVLVRALGMDSRLDVDFQRIDLQLGDLFFLSTDGIHDWLSEQQLSEQLGNLQGQRLTAQQLESAARQIAQQASEQQSSDNLTCLLLQVVSLPLLDVNELYQRLTHLTIPPALRRGNEIDCFIIEKVLHEGPRSHVYLAIDQRDQQRVVLKMPSLNFADDLVYLDGFAKERWIGRKLSDPRIMKILPRIQSSRFLYHICEHIEGITLRQWMYDNPNPPLEFAREIIINIISCARVFQRAGLVHRDLKPENIMVMADRTVKIIDFGTIQIDALDEIAAAPEEDQPLGATDYIAPEYLNGEKATTFSDLFSIAVIGYELLTGELPYKSLQSQSLQRVRDMQWQYRPINQFREDLPSWIDPVFKKATHPIAARRYQALSEFSRDLCTPNPSLVKSRSQTPLIERDPVSFWKGLALILLGIAVLEFFLLLN
ncbi:MAG TPA: protein kinase [Psychromonas sp.]